MLAYFASLFSQATAHLLAFIVIFYLLDIFNAEKIKIIKNMTTAPSPNPSQNIIRLH
jgi:hypothetical protein